MFCKHCGAAISDISDVRTFCGEPVNEERSLIARPHVSGGTVVLAVLGFLFSGIAILFLPPVFDGLSIAFGFIVKKRLQSLGWVQVTLKKTDQHSYVLVFFLFRYSIFIPKAIKSGKI